MVQIQIIELVIGQIKSLRYYLCVKAQALASRQPPVKICAPFIFAVIVGRSFHLPDFQFPHL